MFGKINYCNLLLEDDRCEEVPDVLDNKWNLKLHYPEQNEFHFSEVREFNILASRYFIAKGDINQAEIHLNIAKQVDKENKNVKYVENVIRVKKFERLKNDMPDEIK